MAGHDDDESRELNRVARRREQNRNAQKNLRRRRELAKQAAITGEQQPSKQVQDQHGVQEQVHDWRSNLVSSGTPWSDFSAANKRQLVEPSDESLFDLDEWTDPIYPSPTLSNCAGTNLEHADLSIPDFFMQLEDQSAELHASIAGTDRQSRSSRRAASIIQNTLHERTQSQAGQQCEWQDQTPDLQLGENNDQHTRSTAPRHTRRSSVTPIVHSKDFSNFMHQATARPMMSARSQSSQTVTTRALRTASARGQRGATPLSPTYRAALQSSPTQRGQTCLHLAAKNCSKSLIQYFIARGMDPDVCDADGMTALHYAIHSGHEDIVSLLLASGADVDAIDDHGKTALHHAVEQGQEDIAVLLIHKGADMQATVEIPGKR